MNQAQKPLTQGITVSLNELVAEAQKVHQLTLHLKRPASHQGQAVKQSTTRGRGMEFLETRAYAAPDEMRHIDWRVSARFNGVFTKVFIEEKNRPIYIALDLSPSMFFGSKVCFKSVLACKIAARLAQAVINGQDILNGVIYSPNAIITSKAGPGPRHLMEFLSKASFYNTMWTPLLSKEPPVLSHTDPQQLLKRLEQTVKKGSAIFIISDFLNFDHDAIKPFLFSLKRRADIFFMRVFDPLERKLANVGQVSLSFGDDVVNIDTKSQQILTRFEQLALAKDQEYLKVRELFAIPGFDFSTSDAAHLDLSRLFLGRW